MRDVMPIIATISCTYVDEVGALAVGITRVDPWPAFVVIHHSPSALDAQLGILQIVERSVVGVKLKPPRNDDNTRRLRNGYVGKGLFEGQGVGRGRSQAVVVRHSAKGEDGDGGRGQADVDLDSEQQEAGWQGCTPRGHHLCE